MERFPDDFMFSLTREEIMGISQFVTSSPTGRGNLRFSKSVMAFRVWHSHALQCSEQPKAIQINIQIMRTFGKLREMIATHKDLARKLEDLEKKYDAQFQVVFNAIRELMTLPEPKKRKIGFSAKERQAVYGTSRKR